MEITEEEKKELLENVQTSLLFTDIEIIDYQKNSNSEVIVIDLPFVTTGNILTYEYDMQKETILLRESLICTKKREVADSKPLLDNNTITTLFKIARRNSNQVPKSKDKHKVKKRIPKNKV